ncbi:hypothetical protein DFY03_24035 [Escherichia coli]|nr:hypothetical protein [Escherichia coli]
MHPVLGTMMPEICEAPHLPVFPFIHHRAPDLMGWDVFITFPEQLNQNGIYRCSGTDRMMFVSGYTCVTGNKCQCGQVNSPIVY